MSLFKTSRNVELSVIYYLETQIKADWTGVSIVKSFINAYKEPLPVVAIRLTDCDYTRREIGSTTLLTTYTITIDLFCKSDGQRIDLSDFIIDKLKDGCIYYDHSQTSGDPETLTRVANGRLHTMRFVSNNKVDFGEEGVDIYDKFRSFIQIQMRKV